MTDRRQEFMCFTSIRYKPVRPMPKSRDRTAQRTMQTADTMAGFGKVVGVIHPLTDAAHLAKEGIGQQVRDDQLAPLRGHAINLHRALPQEKQRLARLARRVQQTSLRKVL